MRRARVRPRLSGEAGFSLVELVVATGIMVAATAAIFTLMNPSQGMFQAQPEVSDMQQRLRIGVDSLQKDLVVAGAGTYSGAAVGALSNFFAPVMPYRAGSTNPDPVLTFRSDTISLLYVPPTAAQTSVSDKTMPQPSAELKVNPQPGCPLKGAAADPLCGFDEGDRVLIFDDTGTYDTFTITNKQEDANPPHLQHRDDTLSKEYPTNAFIAMVANHTYYLKTDTGTNTYQLMHYDGYKTDLPVADNVVALEFEYFGEPAAPVLLRPLTESVGPWTSYGPKPPALGKVGEGTGYPAGENCLFQVDATSGVQVSRLPTLAATPGLVPLTAAMLTDGPCCPRQDCSGNSYDADLLRVRQVRTTLRVQVASAWLRGPAGTLFTRGGTSGGGARFVPDQEVKFDITPRNLNMGR